MKKGIGGLLAQTGANIGSQVGGAYGQLGSDIGGMLSGIGAKRQQKKQTREVQELLAKYQNNPAQLNAVAAKYASEGNDALAKVFAQSAQRSVDAQAKKTQQAGQAGLVGLGQVLKGASPQERQAILRDASGSLTAQGITAEQIQGVAKETQEQGTRQRLEQNVMGKIQRTVKDEEQKRSLMERYKGASEEDLRKYLSGAGVTGKDRYSVVGNKVFDNVTGSFIADPGKDAPKPDYKYIKSKDGSISVFQDGKLTQTLPPPGSGQGNSESGLMLIQQTNDLLNDITKLKDIGWTESGFIGGVTSMLPGTSGFDREKDLLSLRARLGLDEVNEMKRLAQESGASGTGLGQISNIEFMSLQSSRDAIYPGMSEEAQLEALENLERHFTIIQKLASGVAAKDAINWDTPEYRSRGYVQDKETGSVFYAPDGDSGKVYKLVDGKFTPVEI